MKSYGYVLILSLFFLQSSVFGLEVDSSEAPPLSASKRDSSEVLFKKMLLKIPSGGRVEEEVFEGPDLRGGHLLKAEWIRKVVGTENFYLVSSGIQIFSSDSQGQAERALVWAEISPEMEKRKASVEALKYYLKRSRINVEDEKSAPKALFARYCNGPDFIYGEENSSEVQGAVAFLLRTQMLPTQKNIQAVRALGLVLSSYMGPIPEARKIQDFKKKILQWHEKNPSFGPMNSELMEIPQELFSLLIIDPKLKTHCPDLKTIKYAPGYFCLSGSCEMRLISLSDEESCAGMEFSLSRAIFREKFQRELQDILYLAKGRLYSSKVEVPPISNLAYLAFLNFKDNQKQRAIINLVFLGQELDFGDLGNVGIVEELHALPTDVRYAEKLQSSHFSTDFWVTESLLNLWRTASPEDQEAMVHLCHLYPFEREITLEDIRMLERIRQGVGKQQKLDYKEIPRRFMDVFSSLVSDETGQDAFLYLVEIKESFWGILEHWHWEKAHLRRGEDELYFNLLKSPYLEAVRKIRDNNEALEKTPFDQITPAFMRSWVESSSEAEKEAIVHVTHLNLDYEQVVMNSMTFHIMQMRKGLKGASPIPFHRITREVILEYSKHFMGASSSIICLVGLEKPIDEMHLKIVKGLEHVLHLLHLMKNPKNDGYTLKEHYGEVTNAMMAKVIEDPSQLKILEELCKFDWWTFSYLQEKLELRQDFKMFLESFKLENGLT